ncbi:Coiled-coil domain-containing protein 47 [Termitomyces sp. J132]|nr:Coiled-coil domain-containing protein 47 [Termitomyces sp. J132]
MASFLQRILQVLTPPPHINSPEYDGLEFKRGIFVFRPALFQLELYLLSALAVYLAFTYLGIYRNKTKANRWRFNASLPLLEKQFSKPLGKDRLTKDGNSDYYTFSTGRRNVASLHTVYTLKPRHDLFQYLYHFARTLIDLHYRPKDDITLDFKLAPGALPHDFVWAVVAKDELLSIKQDRWDLTFTKTSENSVLPSSLSVMSEFADVTDTLLKPALVAALKNPNLLPYFRSLSVTDQPRQRPQGPLPLNKRQKHVVLSLTLPDHVEVASGLLAEIFSFIDSLNAINLRPETKTKLKKVREELDKSLKADAEREKKEEEQQAADDRKAAKRRLEQDKIAKLPAAEQQKKLEKERKRMLRKSQGKVVRK